MEINSDAFAEHEESSQWLGKNHFLGSIGGIWVGLGLPNVAYPVWSLKWGLKNVQYLCQLILKSFLGYKWMYKMQAEKTRKW